MLSSYFCYAIQFLRKRNQRPPGIIWLFHSWKFFRYLMFTLEMSWCSLMVMIQPFAWSGPQGHRAPWPKRKNKTTNQFHIQMLDRSKQSCALPCWQHLHCLKKRKGKVIVLSKMTSRSWADQICRSDFCHSVVDKHFFSLQRPFIFGSCI